MDKVNPLQIEKLASVSESKITNVRGRPKLKEIIKFSAQPISIVSQTLIKIKSENSDFVIPIDDKDWFSNSPDNEESSQMNGRFQSIGNEKQEKTPVPGKSNFYCDYKDCSYSCKLSCNLLKHKRTHTNDKPYLCDKCSFRSNFVNSLKSHKRIHTQERPYSCKHCSYRCNSSSNLKKHCLHRHPEVIKGN